MPNPVIVHLALNCVSEMHRHRVSVWNDDGGLLYGPSADSPAEVTVGDGATIFVEASVPAEPRRNHAPARDEARWRLRASADAHDILRLGRTRRYGTSSAIAIHVDGAEQHRRGGASA